MRLFVANINFHADASDLREFFVEAGYLPTEVKICTERENGRSRGIAFVELAEDGDRAIADLDQMEFMGRRVYVKKAAPRPPRPLHAPRPAA